MIFLMMCLLMPQAKSEGALPTETRPDAETSVPANSINATNEYTDDMHLTEAQYFDALSVLELEEMVQLRKRSGQYDDALRHLTILIKRVDDLDYHYEEALLYELKEDYAQAAQRYEAILMTPELSPVFRRNIQFRYGIVLSDMGLDRDALAVFRTVARAKDLKPHEKLILEYARGVAYIYSGKTPKGSRKINKKIL
ncbi:MAG: hypothetical protein VX026_13010, partial [Myxococcota bacterium]|nr:hypothetical protein [Myxococcota bacterium]